MHSRLEVSLKSMFVCFLEFDCCQFDNIIILDIVVISRDEVATCSNDGRICFWSIDTTNFKVTMRLNFEDSEFIYSLSTVNGGSILASAGESTGVKVFVDGRFNQNLPIPALSAWCVRILDNGDIAVGCSDNRIYVFTQNPEREASEELIALYDAEVSRFKEPKEEAMEQGDDSGLPEEVGGVKVADMPGPEVLDRTGRRDGQTVMVREGNTVSVHSWSQADGQWRKVGDVVGQRSDRDPNPTLENKEPLGNKNVLEPLHGLDCSTCFEPRTRTFLLLPCGHATFCEKCATYFCESEEKRCPTCRATITGKVRVFS